MSTLHPPDSRAEAQRLRALLGTWKTQGAMRAGEGASPAAIDAVDTYQWLPGECALLHRVEGTVGDQSVQGAEIIGYDPQRRAYVTQYVGSDGPNRYEATLLEQDGALVWAMRSARDRFTGTFSADGEVIRGHWEQRDDDSGWQPWMDITLTRQGAARALAGAAEAEIRPMLDEWSDAIQKRDLERVLANHAEDVVLFDVPPPQQLRGLDAYRDSFAGFLPWLGDSGVWELDELNVVAGADVAYAHCLVRCQGTGQADVLDVRVTFGLIRRADRWLITHEHHSVPSP